MDTKIKKAIAEFFTSVKTLKCLGVFRSDKYLGDLGEYICKYLYDIKLAENGRQQGYDGIDTKDSSLVQVKFHGSSTRTNIDLGNPDEYDYVLVVLGPDSLLRDPSNTGDFLIYRFSSETVKNYKQGDSNSYSCGKSALTKAPSETLNLS